MFQGASLEHASPQAVGVGGVVQARFEQQLWESQSEPQLLPPHPI